MMVQDSLFGGDDVPTTQPSSTETEIEWDYNVFGENVSNWTILESSETHHQERTKISDRPVQRMTAEGSMAEPLLFAGGIRLKVVRVNMRRQ